MGSHKLTFNRRAVGERGTFSNFVAKIDFRNCGNWTGQAGRPAKGVARGHKESSVSLIAEALGTNRGAFPFRKETPSAPRHNQKDGSVPASRPKAS